MRISDWSSDVCSSDLVVAAIEVHERIARAFLHDVARPNEALFIIQSGRGFGLFEIAGNGHLRLHPKFAAGIRLVRGEIAEFRAVDQLVIDYGRPETAAIGPDRPRLDRPISFIYRQLETFGDEVLHFGRGRGRARADHAQAVAEKIPAHFGHYFGPDVFVIPSDATLDHLPEIGSASCRERVCQYV